jgi:hypothetical protein
MFQPFVELISLGFLGGHNCANVLQKIDAAFLAGSAPALFVAAGRALKSQSGMAASAEPSYVAHFGAAFRALDHRPRASDAEVGRAAAGTNRTQVAHQKSVLRNSREGVRPGERCAHVVNTGRQASENPAVAARKWGCCGGRGHSRRRFPRPVVGSGCDYPTNRELPTWPSMR